MWKQSRDLRIPSWSTRDAFAKRERYTNEHPHAIGSNGEVRLICLHLMVLLIIFFHRGAEVEFNVNYFEDSRKILEFKEFDVEIRDYYTNYTVAKVTTTSKVVRFPNCSDINVTCSHPIKIKKCLCLPVGNYTMAVMLSNAISKRETNHLNVLF